MIDTTLRVIEKKSFDLSDHSSSLSGVRYVILSCEKKDIDPGKIRLQINDCTSTLFFSWNRKEQAEKFVFRFINVLNKTINALQNNKVLNRHYLLAAKGSVTKYFIHVKLLKNKNCQITIYKKFDKVLGRKPEKIITFHSNYVVKFEHSRWEENLNDFKTRIVNLSLALISLERSLQSLS